MSLLDLWNPPKPPKVKKADIVHCVMGRLEVSDEVRREQRKEYMRQNAKIWREHKYKAAK